MRPLHLIQMEKKVSAFCNFALEYLSVPSAFKFQPFCFFSCVVSTICFRSFGVSYPPGMKTENKNIFISKDINNTPTLFIWDYGVEIKRLNNWSYSKSRLIALSIFYIVFNT